MICTLDGRLLAITDPLPGSRHDARAFRAHGLDQLLDSSTLADKGYVGLGLTTPTKRRPGLGLLREQKTNNRVLNRLRSVVERVIAQVKRPGGFFIPGSGARWARMGGCFLLVRGLVFHAAGRTFE